jgi:hypothetical protein
VTAQVDLQLALAEEIIRTAARSPVTHIPAALSQVVGILESVRAAAPSYPASGRGPLLARLQKFGTKLQVFSSALQRGESMLQGYARTSGISLNQYGPGGVSAAGRDPALFNLTA